MQSFRAKLTDESGQAISEIEGSIQSTDETQAPRRGEFELEDDGSFMQGVLDGKTFHLNVDDGSDLAIHVDSVSASTRPGYSRAEFSCS
jgi:hypothetical protein